MKQRGACSTCLRKTDADFALYHFADMWCRWESEALRHQQDAQAMAERFENFRPFSFRRSFSNAAHMDRSPRRCAAMEQEMAELRRIQVGNRGASAESATKSPEVGPWDEQGRDGSWPQRRDQVESRIMEHLGGEQAPLLPSRRPSSELVTDPAACKSEAPAMAGRE